MRRTLNMGGMMDTPVLEQLRRLIKTNAWRTGDFTLASGRKSDYYIDLKAVTLDGEGSVMVGEAVYHAIRDWNADAVGGMELGSVPISTAVCLVAAQKGVKLSNIIVRKQAKDHGTGKGIEGALKPGARVVVVEDVVSTGGSSLKAIEALEAAGAVIAGVVAIVDREMGGAHAFEGRGLRYCPLLTVSDLRRE